MAPSNLDQQLNSYLTDAHSIEQQALAQMKAAPDLAGDPQIAAVFEDHLIETQDHERLVEARLEARGAKPSKLKDIVGTLTGKGFGAFAKANPDTPGKLVVHAFSYEHMEEAAYDLLARVAERAGDNATAEVARMIEQQERAMGDRLAACFDRAVDASLAAVEPDSLSEQLDSYLADAHAIEIQALTLLEKGQKIAEDSELAAAFEEHHAETEVHQRLITERLEARGSKTSMLKDAALKLGALNWGVFFQAQPGDTPAKLAAFAFAVEHLEIGSYELLRRVAERAGDLETVRVAERILGEEQAAAEKLRSLFGSALDASLAEVTLSSHA